MGGFIGLAGGSICSKSALSICGSPVSRGGSITRLTMTDIPCIRSVLDTDSYKLSMQQAVCRLYPRAMARYQFINRGKTEFPPGFAAKLREQIDAMAGLALGNDEHRWLRDRCGRYLTPVYLDFL
jgi:nicotinate phosphoribosyltransferase